MDQRGMIALEIEKDGGTFTFLMPTGVHFGEAYDAAHEFLAEILEMSSKAVKAAERNKNEEEKPKDIADVPA